MNKQHIRVGEELTLEIKRMGINGEGIAYDQKLAIFITGALPDEVIVAKITEVFNNRALAEIKSIKKASPHRVKPFCPVYETCGGCQLQHLSYQQTKIEKRNLLVQAFDRYLPVKIHPSRIKETLGMEEPKYYRNKATLPVRKTKRNKIGMYASGGTKFVPIDNCPVQDKRVNRILQTTLSLMDSIGVDAFDTKYHRGYVSNVIVRVTNKDEAQVTFTCKKIPNRLPQLAEELMTKEPMVKSVFRVLEEKGSREFFNASLTKILGQDLVEETLDEFTFLLEPEAFFQLNTKQADVFFKTMREVADLKSNDIVIDAYAGTAPIAHYIADGCKHVYAIEVNQASVDSAKKSLMKNNIQNVTVIKDQFKHALETLKEKKIDVMFFDPPRVGLGEETIELIKKFKPKRIVYGSCNPSTLAKDVAALVNEYVLDVTIPIDMFPYTAHVENIVLLSLKTA